MSMMQDGKAFEREALGVADLEKEKALINPYLREMLRNQMYRGYSEEAVRRLHVAHPEEKAVFDKKLEGAVVTEFKDNHHSQVLDKEKAFMIIRQAQPREREPLADDLYNTIAIELGLEEMDENEDYMDLKFYTAVDSKLDGIFGVDAFFIYNYTNPETKEQEEIRVTIDVTTNPAKFKSNSELILHFHSGDSESRKQWKEPVAQYGKEIADKIKQKIVQIENNKIKK